MVVSDPRDKATWRGVFPKTLVPFRLIDHSGTIEQNSSSVEETYMIATEDLLLFVVECFPPPDLRFGIPIFNNRRLPGTNLYARRIRYKGHTSGKPIDPFNRDSTAETLTYEKFLDVTVEYSNEQKPVDPEDPKTFLTIKGSTAGEFLHAGTPKADWEEPDGSVSENKISSGIPATIIVPETQWTLTWEQIPRKFFESTVIKRFRRAMGKVNAGEFSLLFKAPAETLLFLGFDYDDVQSRFTDDSAAVLDTDDEEIRDSIVYQEFVTVTVKILDKHVVDEDDTTRVFGHNHLWKPDVGWRRLRINGNPLYRSSDFDALFGPQTEAEREAEEAEAEAEE